MLEISVLGSGSSGNCALARTAQTTLLVDAGLSARQMTRRLEAQGVDPGALDGILITHEHGDHTRGIDVFCRTRRLPLYCTAMTREVIQDSIRAPMEWRIFESGQAFTIADLEVQSFPVPHDAVDPLGFVIRNSTGAVGVVSDVGHVTNLVKTHLRSVNALFVESNYDEIMLQNDTRRPWPTKQRILSRHGHLSNDQAAEMIAESASEALRHVILGHLSQDCNDPGVAMETVRVRLREAGFPEVEVSCAHQQHPTAWISVGAGAGTDALAPEAPDTGVEQGSLL